MVRHGLTLPDDLIFIKEQIAGPLDNYISDRSVCYDSIALSFLQSSDVDVQKKNVRSK